MKIFRHGFGVIFIFYFTNLFQPKIVTHTILLKDLKKTFQEFIKNKHYYFIVVYIHRQADKYTFKL